MHFKIFNYFAFLEKNHVETRDPPLVYDVEEKLFRRFPDLVYRQPGVET